MNIKIYTLLYLKTTNNKYKKHQKVNKEIKTIYNNNNNNNNNGL